MKGLVKNLFSVCAHIQNPELYSPAVFDKSTLQDSSRLITSEPVSKGTIVSLRPVHALGMRSSTRKRKKLKKTVQVKQQNTDFLVFDKDKDGPYWQSLLTTSLKKKTPINRHRINVPLALKIDQQTLNQDLFMDINPTNLDYIQGWMGHLARRSDAAEANCMVVPLIGAAPFCALVATDDIPSGAELICFSQEDLSPEFTQQYAEHVQAVYVAEIHELGSYLAMAYQPPLQPHVMPTTTIYDDKPTEFKLPFHAISLDYPGLRYLHRDPDILAIDNFLTPEECDRITHNAKSHMIPCVIKHPTTGEVQEDPSRTSTNANLPQSDVPSIVEKLVSLLKCPDASFLETIQILRYTKGQAFYPHTDGFDGPTSACGFAQSGRLVTIFCYLNDVPQGGETKFTNLPQPLSIQPRKGMAVVHFPATTGLEEDPRTEHEGSPAMDEKWLFVTWMWKHPRTDPRYAEEVFPSILN